MTSSVTMATVRARIFTLPERPPFMTVYDLAEFYQVPVKRIMDQMRRNLGRFPADFIFEPTEAEIESLVAQKALPNRINRGVVVVFTKEGALQLCSVLTGPVADEVSVTIIRTFAELERLALDEMRFLLLKLQNEETSRKRIRLQVRAGVAAGLHFDGIRRMGNYSAPVLALAVRECLAMGLIDHLPLGMPMMQADLFAGV